MKQFLLLTMMAGALAMSAAAPVAEIKRVPLSTTITPTQVTNTPTKSHRVAPGVAQSGIKGLKKLRVLDPAQNKINARKHHAPAMKSELRDGYVLFESFEDWDGQNGEWVPEGWSVEMKGDVTREFSWTPSAQAPYMPAPADGDVYYGISYSYDAAQDEWLISPEVTIPEANVLSYWLYLSPSYLYAMDNIDWDTMEFIGEKVVAANLQVLVQPQGGEWTVICDYAEKYKDYSLMELFYLEPEGLERQTVALDEYVGQTVKFAFRYVGIDGNTMFIDAIGVGLPELEGVSYLNPFETLYWGFERDYYMSAINLDIAQYPVYAPLTWNNYSDVYDCDFTWYYMDPETYKVAETSEDPWSLTLTYKPNNIDESTIRNNFITPPALEATAPNATPGYYQAPYALMQAGGKAEYKFADGTFNGNLLPFACNNDGMTFVAVTDDEIGAMGIPVFGYNKFVDQYWVNYSLNGEEATATDHSYLEGIANLFMASSEAPIVVNGISVYGFGNISAEAELTATIYALNEEMSASFETLVPIASATCTGDKISAEYADDSNGYLCIPFNFDEPVAIQASAEHPAFMIMFSGFRSEAVNYFAPIQSAIPDPNYLCLGYILNHIDLSAHGRDPYYSLKPMVYKEDGDYVDPYASFAIALEAEYPWLTTDVETIAIDEDAESTAIAMFSYYKADKLTVEAPEGVSASVANGAYGFCMLNVSRTGADAVDGDITVKGPGVELAIPVKVAKASINTIDASQNGPATIFDLSGRRVDAPAAGVYIIRSADGSVQKRVVK